MISSHPSGEFDELRHCAMGTVCLLLQTCISSARREEGTWQAPSAVGSIRVVPRGGPAQTLHEKEALENKQGNDFKTSLQLWWLAERACNYSGKLKFSQSFAINYSLSSHLHLVGN